MADSTGAPSIKCRGFDPATTIALFELVNCQNIIENITRENTIEKLEVEKRFYRIGKKCYDHREEIITKVPNFWSTAIKNHPVLKTMFQTEELDCLNYLTKIDVEEFGNAIAIGKVLSFYFDENPYFDNAELAKEYQLAYSGDSFAISHPIEWKEGNNLTIPISTLTTVGKRYETSFFGWYHAKTNPYKDPISKIIINDLWVNPLKHYRNSDDSSRGGDGSTNNDKLVPE